MIKTCIKVLKKKSDHTVEYFKENVFDISKLHQSGTTAQYSFKWQQSSLSLSNAQHGPLMPMG